MKNLWKKWREYREQRSEQRYDKLRKKYLRPRGSPERTIEQVALHKASVTIGDKNYSLRTLMALEFRRHALYPQPEDNVDVFAVDKDKNAAPIFTNVTMKRDYIGTVKTSDPIVANMRKTAEKIHIPVIEL